MGVVFLEQSALLKFVSHTVVLHLFQSSVGCPLEDMVLGWGAGQGGLCVLPMARTQDMPSVSWRSERE